MDVVGLDRWKRLGSRLAGQPQAIGQGEQLARLVILGQGTVIEQVVCGHPCGLHGLRYFSGPERARRPRAVHTAAAHLTPP